MVDSLVGDEKTGAQIILRAVEEPLRQISKNAGVDGGVIVNQVKQNNSASFGYNALTDEFVDMFDAGIIDPTKVTKSALVNAASVASTLLTTESLVTDLPEKQGCNCGGGMPNENQPY